jgi:hypothetical protein
MKDEYPKLSYFKVWIHFFKSDKRLGVIIKKFPSFFFSFWCLNKNCALSLKCSYRVTFYEADNLSNPSGLSKEKRQQTQFTKEEFTPNKLI